MKNKKIKSVPGGQVDKIMTVKILRILLKNSINNK